ncbi:MAG TPA: hypothetical protein VGB77_10340 [Abditibacteriaceae bacterium]|jgi:hypothetical protein
MSVSTFIAEPEPEPPPDFEEFYHAGYGKAWVNEAELPEVRRHEKNCAVRAWERFLNAVQWHSEREPEQAVEEPEITPPVLQLLPGGPRRSQKQGAFQSGLEGMTRAVKRGTARTGVAAALYALRESLEALEHDDSPPDLREFYAQYQALGPLFHDIARRADWNHDE